MEEYTHSVIELYHLADPREKVRLLSYFSHKKAQRKLCWKVDQKYIFGERNEQ